MGALAGLAVGYRLYSRWQEREPLMRLGPAYTFVERKYLLDDLYLRGIVKPIQYPLANDVDRVDRTVVDGAVNGAGALARGLGAGLKYLQSGSVQRYAALLVLGVFVLVFVVARG